MTTASLKPGDIVEVDKKGRRFIAVVKGVTRGGFDVRPIDSRVSYHSATSREICGIWHANLETRRQRGLA